MPPSVIFLGNIIGTQPPVSKSKSSASKSKSSAPPIRRSSPRKAVQTASNKSQQRSAILFSRSSSQKSDISQGGISLTPTPASQASQGEAEGKKAKAESVPTFRFKKEQDQIDLLDWLSKEDLVYLTRSSKYFPIFIIKICHFLLSMCIFMPNVKFHAKCLNFHAKC